jgi:hypothetical protein
MRAPAQVFALIAAAGCCVVALAPAAGATSAAVAEVLAEPPSNLAVTVYRAPYRNGGSINLNYLNGFAFVSETRLVRLPAGTSRLRFEGVANGIEPASAIITGLGAGVIEKNRDARLLSPSALLDSAVGKPVELLRTIRKTGKLQRVAGTILSDAGGGVVFQSEQGIEALRCSGLPETFSFEPAAHLSARPTLSVVVRSRSAMITQVTLSYLSRGFDWAADYTATLSPDGKTLDLGAWVTLANSNGMGFPLAHTQVVAGRVNREDGEVDPVDIGGPILAQCWPRGSTSDIPVILRLDHANQLDMLAAPAPAARMASLGEVALTRKKEIMVQQEQLGDLKLYRVPERTTLSSRQSKQVRLMDRTGIPVSTVYGADLAGNSTAPSAPAHRLLRTVNSTANHLGLPLPSGAVSVFAQHKEQRLLAHQSTVRDLAVDEEVEIDMGLSPDVEVTVVNEKTTIEPQRRRVRLDDARVEVSNARASSIQFELRLQLPAGARVIHADHPLSSKNGRPLFRLTIPANQTATVRYQTQRPS